MKKLKLGLDELQVETFAVDPEHVGRKGTVKGHDTLEEEGTGLHTECYSHCLTACEGSCETQCDTRCVRSQCPTGCPLECGGEEELQ